MDFEKLAETRIDWKKLDIKVGNDVNFFKKLLESLNEKKKLLVSDFQNQITNSNFIEDLDKNNQIIQENLNFSKVSNDMLDNFDKFSKLGQTINEREKERQNLIFRRDNAKVLYQITVLKRKINENWSNCNYLYVIHDLKPDIFDHQEWQEFYNHYMLKLKTLENQLDSDLQPYLAHKKVFDDSSSLLLFNSIILYPRIEIWEEMFRFILDTNNTESFTQFVNDTTGFAYVFSTLSSMRKNNIKMTKKILDSLNEITLCFFRRLKLVIENATDSFFIIATDPVCSVINRDESPTIVNEPFQCLLEKAVHEQVTMITSSLFPNSFESWFNKINDSISKNLYLRSFYSDHFFQVINQIIDRMKHSNELLNIHNIIPIMKLFHRIHSTVSKFFGEFEEDSYLLIKTLKEFPVTHINVIFSTDILTNNGDMLHLIECVYRSLIDEYMCDSEFRIQFMEIIRNSNIPKSKKKRFADI